jgi:cytidylate kinase
MAMTDEIERLRKKAAELVERAARRNTPLSPKEDAEIIALLKEARDLENRDKRDRRAPRAPN